MPDLSVGTRRRPRMKPRVYNEADRTREQVKLRLMPHEREDLEALARHWETSISSTVAALVRQATAAARPMTRHRVTEAKP